MDGEETKGGLTNRCKKKEGNPNSTTTLSLCVKNPDLGIQESKNNHSSSREKINKEIGTLINSSSADVRLIFLSCSATITLIESRAK